MIHRITAIAVALSLGVSVARAAPDDEPPISADDYLRVGLERYEAEDFEAAIQAFAAGYAIEPRPAFLFAAAQAERRSGDCRSAIIYYDRFIATSPPQSQVTAAREQRARCVAALGSEPIVSDDERAALPMIGEANPDRGSARASAPGVRASAWRPWYTSPLTDVLAGSAIVFAATGIGFTITASSAVDEANRADTYDAHERAADRAGTHRTIGLVCFGGSVAVGAIAVWRILRHDGGGESARVTVAPGPGLGVAIGGAF